MFFKKKSKPEPDQLHETPPFWTAEIESEHNIVQEEPEQEPQDPILACEVYLNYGRVDLCKQEIKDALVKQPEHKVYKEIQQWLATGNANLDTWNNSWKLSVSHVLKEADELVKTGNLKEALELLENALLNNEPGQDKIRMALRNISNAMYRKH